MKAMIIHMELAYSCTRPSPNQWNTLHGFPVFFDICHAVIGLTRGTNKSTPLFVSDATKVFFLFSCTD